MANLFHFLTEFAVDPAKQISFRKNPQLVMTEAGLSQAEQAIIASRSHRQIDAVFADKNIPFANICADPGPDPLPDPDPT